MNRDQRQGSAAEALALNIRRSAKVPSCLRRLAGRLVPKSRPLPCEVSRSDSFSTFQATLPVEIATDTCDILHNVLRRTAATLLACARSREHIAIWEANVFLDREKRHPAVCWPRWSGRSPLDICIYIYIYIAILHAYTAIYIATCVCYLSTMFCSKS